MRRYQIKEWSLLPFSKTEGDGGISRRDADALCIEAERQSEALSPNGGPTILSLERRGLRASQVVGVVATGGCRLEILPKIDSKTGDLPSAALFKMLAAVPKFKIAMGGLTDAVLQDQDILEILIGRFAQRLSWAAQRGLSRRYLLQEEDLPFLKGKLNTTRQFTRFAASPHLLATRFDELDIDIPLNQILKAACMLLLSITISSRNRRRLNELSFHFASVSDLPVGQPLPVQQVKLDRTNGSYRQLLEMALLFLNRRTQALYGGQGKGFSLLFEMNTLFEEYIGANMIALQERLAHDCSLQKPVKHVLKTLNGAPKFRTKPDIWLRDRVTKAVTIIDTKWKVLKGSRPDVSSQIQSGDIYQMLAYASVYDADRVILLYPHSYNLDQAAGVVEQFQSHDGSHRIDIATVDLSDLSTVRAQMTSMIVDGALGEDSAINNLLQA